MTDTPVIALVGDYSPEVLAHRAIPLALEQACAATQVRIAWKWIATTAIQNAEHDLEDVAAVWLVPASPYRNTAGALAAVRWAREKKRAFLGTCGGFQHALIEFARNVAQLPEAEHTQTHPAAAVPLIIRLNCSLVKQTGLVRFAPGSRLHAIYGRAASDEGYRCSYGLNPHYLPLLERAGLQFTAHDETGDIRAAELPASLHPFFIGTLFQPERAALRGATPPIVAAFVRAATNVSG